jgi:CheY-like chemotaxis protein
MSAPESKAQINLSKAIVLLIDGSQHSVDVFAQIMKGFGVGEIHRCLSIADADRLLRIKVFDLIIMDPAIEDGAGYELLRTLRRMAGSANAYAPVITASGYVRASDVARARDAGANYFVSKPVTPASLLQRIMFVGRDQRPFIDAGGFIGPDRRHKFEGPPKGCDGRRAEDLKTPLGDADEPNMSQNEIDMLIRPQRVSL